ncbi:hypothetical protein ACQPUY_17210 [Clostridium nigeriense]|uniref:hypothetical protein n=1 Tax=Clostridium nigeriense TaxID=1805470 RepID=UPI003D3310C4
MLVVTYKEINKDGVIHLPFEKKKMKNAKQQADRFHKKGYLNVKVVEIEEKIIYEPEVR